MKDIKDKLVLITGGARGIGFGLAEAFAAAGSRVILADVDRAVLDLACERLAAQGTSVEAIELDVTSPDSWQAAADHVAQRHGGLDILCNNAGAGAGRSAQDGPTGFADVSLDLWHLIQNVNVNGVFYGIRAFVPGMLARGKGGHVVNTGSMASFLAPKGMAAYCSSKFAVLAMSETLAAELLDTEIGVSVLCPGGVRSEFVETSARRSAEAAGHDFTPPPQPFKMLARSAGERVVQAVRNNEFYIFTHPEYEPLVQERLGSILAAFGASAQPDYSDSPQMLAGSDNPLYARQAALRAAR